MAVVLGGSCPGGSCTDGCNPTAIMSWFVINRSIMKMLCYERVIYLFNYNLATGGSLTGAILSCHVELSKYSTS